MPSVNLPIETLRIAEESIRKEARGLWRLSCGPPKEERDRLREKSVAYEAHADVIRDAIESAGD